MSHDLYVSEDDYEEIEFGDTTVKLKELPGEQFLNMVDEVANKKGVAPEDVKDIDVAREIFPRVIVEPEDIDVGKLKSSVMKEIMEKVAEMHGATPESKGN